MALLSKKEFGELVGKPTKELSVYVSRRKIIVSEGELIDPLDPINKAFLQKFGGIKSAKPDKVAPSAPEEQDDESPDSEGVNPLLVSDRRYKHFSAEQKKKSVELIEIDIARKRGELIPPDLIKPLFHQHNQSILVEFKNMMDEELRFIAKEYSLSVDHVALIKGRWVKGLNDAMDRSKKTTAKGIANIVEDYSEKK